LLIYLPVTLHNMKRLMRRSWHIVSSAGRFRQYDLIISELLTTAWHGMVLGKLARRSVILDEHNIEWLLAYQLGLKARYNWRLLQRYEKMCWRNFDHTTVTSQKDKGTVVDGCGKSDSEKVSVVPNGVDCSIFTRNEVQREIMRNRYSINERPTILFMGSFGYFPNVDAAQTIIKEIYPLVKKLVPNILFMFIGREAEELVTPTVKDFFVPGLVNDVPSHINASDICIAPLRFGSGTRLKILEWMACGRAVIATEKAAEGLDVAHGENIIIENDIERYAFWIAKLLAEQDIREKIGRNARALVETKYEWKACILPMVSAIKGVLELN
ncbi:MAG: glycosyltransferase family 4 protein, partial [Nitrososphaerales archaeon]